MHSLFRRSVRSIRVIEHGPLFSRALALQLFLQHGVFAGGYLMRGMRRSLALAR